ncbi:MAG: succinylglutamate desuccinylase/aspartoacylase family protein [Planctomycetota bacterium]
MPESATRRRRAPFELADTSVPAGQRQVVNVPLPGIYGREDVALPVEVVHGRREGPRLFVAAALHGDEVGGTEVIRRLLLHRSLNRMAGTLLAIPVVNVYGYWHQSRYLPDRRDLNRCFPGSPGGSLASRLAHVLMSEVVARCSHGIDLHTATIHRENLPQVRGGLDDPVVRTMCEAFAAPVIIDASLRDGSLREAVRESGIPMVVYEAGEALRLVENAVRAGLRGVLGVMSALGMVRARQRWAPGVVAKRTYWVRSPCAGILVRHVGLGDRISREAILGTVGDPLLRDPAEVRAAVGGVVIGRTNNPLVNEGDGLYHIAVFGDREETAGVAGMIEELDQQLDDGQWGSENA